MLESFLQRAKHSHLILILFILSYFFLMLGNGIISLTHPDEVFYAQTAKEMITHNSWLTPLIFDWPQFEKPVFFYWLLAGARKVFGEGPFVARFWPAFFGMVGVVVTYAAAWLLFRHKRIAFLSGVVLMSSLIYLALSRAVLTDMVFSIWVVMALVAFLWAYYERRYKTIGIILFFVLMGISVLTKGLLGVLFPLTAVLGFLLYKKEMRFLKTPALLWGILAFCAVAVPWHWVMYQRYGQTFIDDYWHNVHIRRIFVAEHPRNDTWYFYMGLMFAGVMPWSFFLIPALGRGYKAVVELKKERDAFMFLLWWVVSVYSFVQPAHSKLASYIFPVYPALAICIGYYLNQILEKKAVFAQKVIGGILTAMMLGGSVAAVIFARQYDDFVPDFTMVYVASGLMLICAGALLFFTFKRRYYPFIVSNLSITVIILIVLFTGRPSAEPWVSCKDITDQFKQIEDDGSTVLASKFYVRGIRYYTDRKMAVIDINGKGFFTAHPIPFLNTPEKVMDFLAQQPVTYAVLKEGDVRKLKEIAADRYRIQDIGEGIGGKYILRIERIQSSSIRSTCFPCI